MWVSQLYPLPSNMSFLMESNISCLMSNGWLDNLKYLDTMILVHFIDKLCI
jgi:hypothetical protein